MTRYYLLLFILLLIAPSLYAQYSYETGNALEFYNANQSTRPRQKELTQEEIAGSPYLNPDFQKGVVATFKNIKYPDIPLRYNIYNDEMEFKNNKDQILSIANPELVRFIELGSDKWTYRPYFNLKRLKHGFFLILEEGEVSLLVKKNIIFQKAKPTGAYSDAESAKFVTKTDHFFLQVKGKAAQLIPGKKELPALFPDKQKELATFIKKNKIKTTKSEDLIELVRYYHSL